MLADAINAIPRVTAPAMAVGYSTAMRVVGPKGVSLIMGWTFEGTFAANDSEIS